MHSYIAVCGRGAVVGGHKGTGARQMTERKDAAAPLLRAVAEVDRQLFPSQLRTLTHTRTKIASGFGPEIVVSYLCYSLPLKV